MFLPASANRPSPAAPSSHTDPRRAGPEKFLSHVLSPVCGFAFLNMTADC